MRQTELDACADRRGEPLINLSSVAQVLPGQTGKQVYVDFSVAFDELAFFEEQQVDHAAHVAPRPRARAPNFF
jgi:hypothetical protein